MCLTLELQRSAQFLVSRLIRIVPDHWLVIVFTAFLLIGFASLFNNAGFSFEKFGFDPSLKLGWTLTYEMFFYVVLYVCFLVTKFYRSCASCIFVGIVCVGYFLKPRKSSSTHFYTDPIILAFCLGILLFEGHRKRKILTLTVMSSFWFAGVFLLSLYCLIYRSFSVAHRLFEFGLLSLVLIFCTLQFESECKHSLVKRLLMSLGEMSYIFYLILMFILAIYARLFDFLFFPGFFLSIFSILVACFAIHTFWDLKARALLNKLFLY